MKKILIAAVMVLALSAVASAQTVGARYTVASVPESFVSCCGQAEKSGEIGFTAVPGSPVSVKGTITVTYPVPITNKDVNYLTPPLSGIGVVATAQSYAGATGIAPGVSINEVKNEGGKGMVIFNVEAGGVYPYTITLFGVRLDVSGACDSSIYANVTSTGNLITAGETEVQVINMVKQALRTPTIVGGFPVAINAVSGVPNPATVTLEVKENFLDAFGRGPGFDPSANMSKMIRLNVSKVPAGITLSFEAEDNYHLFGMAASNGAFVPSPAVVTAANSPAQIYYRLTTDSSAVKLESMGVDITITSTNPYPLPAGSVDISAHVAPFDASFFPTLFPRYDDDPMCETGKVTILTIVGSSTTLLVPYAVSLPTSFYNTGIAVANTSKDPGRAAFGFTGAVPQNGTMTFFFYPSVGDPFQYTTTAGSPGNGLEADGKLAAGRTYAVLLSELVDTVYPGEAREFQGYFFIVTNFTNAHGEYFVSDFEYFTHGALMMVVDRDPATGRTAPEALNN